MPLIHRIIKDILRIFCGNKAIIHRIGFFLLTDSLRTPCGRRSATATIHGPGTRSDPFRLPEHIPDSKPILFRGHDAIPSGFRITSPLNLSLTFQQPFRRPDAIKGRTDDPPGVTGPLAAREESGRVYPLTALSPEDAHRR
jgi:hypothetical protein